MERPEEIGSRRGDRRAEEDDEEEDDNGGDGMTGRERRRGLDLGAATGEESRGGRRQRRGWNETAAGIEPMARMSVYLII